MKTFILDTNVLLHDPKALKVFDDNEVVIPISVLDELDNAKTRPDEKGRNAREVVRILDKLRSSGSLSSGVKLDESTIRVEINHNGNAPNGLNVDKVDNRILNTALGLMSENKENKEIIVVSKDINLRVKCDALGVTAQDYERDKITSDLSSIYTGVKTLHVSPAEIDSLYANGHIILEETGFLNQFFILKSLNKQTAITRYVGDSKFIECRLPKQIWGISPRNVEQKMALDLLLDPNIKLVTIIGRSGAGKTLLACAAALQQILKDTTYSRTLISRPIQPMGKDVGFLPGSIEEKLNPWMQPIYDNLEFLLGADQQMINEYKYNGLIQVEPLTYIRGRSIPKSFFIVDECQNLTAQEMKTIITRMGQDSKIVITGDIEQIDNPYVDFADNGLTHVVERFKDKDIAGHITLRKGERSKLATMASEIL